MNCPECRSRTRVRYVRHRPLSEFRLRECLACKARFQTRETLIEKNKSISVKALVESTLPSLPTNDGLVTIERQEKTP